MRIWGNPSHLTAHQSGKRNVAAPLGSWGGRNLTERRASTLSTSLHQTGQFSYSMVQRKPSGSQMSETRPVSSPVRLSKRFRKNLEKG
jgi:hypothetical protein